MQNCRKYSFIKILGHLTPAEITLKRRLLWDVVQIDWKEVLMTLNGNMVHLLHQ